MKKSKLFVPLTLGLVLLGFTVVGLMSVTLSSCEDLEGTHCTNKDYPLYCSLTGNCCPAGYAHMCDGQCYQSGCPSGTVHSSICSYE